MKIHHLSDTNSALNHFLAEIRDVSVQGDSMRFRRNIERIGEVMAYELSKTLDYRETEIQTPLGVKKTAKIRDSLVICSILRAGLPLHNGFLNVFDAAENGFISAYRHHPDDGEHFDIKVEYQAIADINGKTVLLVDPMLATGQSLVAVYQRLMARGTPKQIHVAVVVSAPQGIEYLGKHLPDTCHLWIAARDDSLDKHSYILPGLGDAGDLAFGEKL
jgi:uracil phosphoribosyltransferase